MPKRRQQRRQQVEQQGCGIGGKMALNELPNLYEKGASKVKNTKN